MLYVICDVSGGCSGQYQHGIYYQYSYPLDADGDNYGQGRGKHAFHQEGMYAAASCEGGVYAENQEPVEDPAPQQQYARKDTRESRQILGHYAEKVSYEIGGELLKAASVGHEHEAKGDCRGRKDPYYGIHGSMAFVLDIGDEPGEQY